VAHSKGILEHLKNHPSVVYYTVFNEGWGQFDCDNVYRTLKAEDPSRVFDATSGWFFGKESDVCSLHVYFKPFRPARGDKPLVLSEFGGYAFMPEDHAFHPGKEYGYRHYKTREEFALGVQALYRNEIIPAVKEGLCAAIYTQVSDVEDETNGLLSYDRKVLKYNPSVLKNVHKAVIERASKASRAN
jgi:hypothetical protein